MYNPFSLEGKTILVTGASSGIGRATAIECSKMGATVVITGRNWSQLIETQNSMKSHMGGGKSTIIRCNLTDETELNQLFESTPVLHGAVLNAGISRLSPVKSIRREVLKQVLETNTVSAIMLLQKLLKSRKLADGSSVVFTSSMSALGETAVGTSIYSASKGALTAFVRVAALEVAGRGIRVNAICPGEVRTGMIADNDLMSGEADAGIRRYPLKRYGEPRDIALAMVYFLSDASSWVTGTNFVIDGGMSIA